MTDAKVDAARVRDDFHRRHDVVITGGGLAG
jgi:hypothetical protein